MKTTLLILTLLISGCSVFNRDIQVVPTKVPIVCDVRVIEGIDSVPVKWQLGRNEEGKYILGLDGKDYSNLSIFIGRATDYIFESRQYINYLEECIEDFNREIKKGP